MCELCAALTIILNSLHSLNLPLFKHMLLLSCIQKPFEDQKLVTDYISLREMSALRGCVLRRVPRPPYVVVPSVVKPTLAALSADLSFRRPSTVRAKYSDICFSSAAR